jgi:hypothetical protein
MEVVEVPAVGTTREPLREAARDETVEERSDVLAVPDAGKRLILAAQAIPTVQGDRHKEARLSLAEAQRHDRLDAFSEGHPSHSR